MRKYGIISAIMVEQQWVRDNLTGTEVHRYASLDFLTGKYGNTDIVAVCCGICKVNAAIAAQILIDRFGITHMIMVGTAGSLCSRVKLFDTIIGQEFIYHDVEPGILINHHPKLSEACFSGDPVLCAEILCAVKNTEHEGTVYAGKIATGEIFVTRETGDILMEEHSPDCVDMESSATAHVCHVNGIPMTAIRSISDTPEENGDDAFMRNLDKTAAKSLSVLKLFLDMNN